MKKITLLSFSLLILAYVGCNNAEEKKAEEVSVETAVEQMTQALDTTNAVAPVSDTMAAH